MNTQIVSLRVWGDYALFSRPDLKVERLSYPILTPSAARGVLDAILFKPQMMWHVRKITALKPNFPPGFPSEAMDRPYRFVSVRRNEIQGKVSTRKVDSWIKEPASAAPYLVDSAGRDGPQGENRTQRNSTVLQHVAYRIDASPILTPRANQPRKGGAAGADDLDGPDTPIKYAEMFRRRVRKGQCFHRPYLGCREFACDFAEATGEEPAIEDWTESLGLMLYDIDFSGGTNRPGYFRAAVVRGVLHCDTEAAGPDGEPPVCVIGWDEKGSAR
jgi:CRISPR-associated protein Cas5d